jgi:hypothetical protein
MVVHHFGESAPATHSGSGSGSDYDSENINTANSNSVSLFKFTTILNLHLKKNQKKNSTNPNVLTFVHFRSVGLLAVRVGAGAASLLKLVC